MKIAVVIDPDKIKKLKKQINKKAYMEHAIKQLAYELSMIFK